MPESSENLSFLKSQLEKVDNNIQNLFSSKSDRENKLVKTIQKYNDSLPLLNRKLNEIEFELDKTSQQIEEKKILVDKLYKTIDEIGEYKSQTEKAINKHDEAILRHKNWWDKLTTNIQYQGKFNQEILENVLTAANLIKGRDFITETKHTTYDIAGNDEKDVRPDVILKFPERNYVVDAKMSLTNWTDFILEKDENKKKEHLKKHLTSIRKHLFDTKTGLIKKNYNKLYGLKSLQSVIVFFPSDNLKNATAVFKCCAISLAFS